MVDANMLGEYEFWTWLATGCLSVLIWFGSMWASSEGVVPGYAAGTLAFGAVTLVCAARAWWRRRVMMRRVTRMPLVEYGDGTKDDMA